MEDNINFIDFNVRDRVRRQVYVQVRDQVSNHVNFHVWDQVGYQVRNEVYLEIENLKLMIRD